MAEMMEIGIIPKRIPLKPNASVWENLKEYLPSCSIARIIWCLMQRGWKYADIAHVLGTKKTAISQYVRRWENRCMKPSLRIGKCIDCERYVKMLQLFGVDVKQIERESWFWGDTDD